MKLAVYTIHDRKAVVYHQPFYAPNDLVAVRMLEDTLRDGNTSLARHPSDYVCFHSGFFDDATGMLEPLPALRHVSDLLALMPEPAAELPLQLVKGGV